MTRLRHDLNYVISAGLLLAALIASLTGIVAHLWDLNDFIYHTYAGYALTVLSFAHVWLNWGRLVGYACFRLRGRSDGAAPARPAIDGGALAARNASAGERVRRALLSRRGFFQLALGGLGGLLLGRGLRQRPAIAQGEDLGVVYHQWSKPGVIDVLGTVAHWGAQPPLYKTYPELPAIALPPPSTGGGLLTEAAISRRRSTRDYAGRSLSMAELSRLLRYTGGLTGERWGNQLRAAPSSGALYPIEIYIAAHQVAGLEAGLYHYGVPEHSLTQLRTGDLREAIVRQGLMQEFLGQANLVLIFTVIFQRMRWKYQDRTYRYGLIEAGHLGQNAYLAATSMGLGACGVGAFLDDEINQLLGVDGREEAAIYLLAVGTV